MIKFKSLNQSKKFVEILKKKSLTKYIKRQHNHLRVRQRHEEPLRPRSPRLAMLPTECKELLQII